MGNFRDWAASLRRASYGGARFFVESDKYETGRRLVVHEFPHRNDPYVEDLGRSANKIEVTAYLVDTPNGGDTSAAARSLRSTCDAGGAKTLSLPLESLRAHCEKCSRDFSKDKLGYIAFSLSFVRDGSGAAPYPLPYIARLVETAGSGIAGLLSSFFVRSFATIDFAGYVQADASNEIRSIAGQLDSTFRAVPLDTTKAPTVLQSISDLFSDADILAATGERADQYGDTSFVMQQSPSAADEIVDRINTIFELAIAAADPDVISEAVMPLAEFVPVEVIGHTPSAKQSAANVAALRMALRIFALTALAGAIVNTSYGDRRQATQARADAAELFGAELDRISGVADYDLFVAIQNLSGQVADYLSRLIVDLAPIVLVSAPVRMPALWWSQRLYGTYDRASELVSRNSVKHPGFMPTDFEALAS